MNPLNYVSYEYTQDIYQCHCPSESDYIEDSTIIEQGYGWKYVQKHTGAFKCSQTIDCVVYQDGEVWNATHLPMLNETDVFSIGKLI